MLSHEIDFAVHSLKDLPTQLPERLVLGAVTEREIQLMLWWCMRSIEISKLIRCQLEQ